MVSSYFRWKLKSTHSNIPAPRDTFETKSRNINSHKTIVNDCMHEVTELDGFWMSQFLINSNLASRLE